MSGEKRSLAFQRQCVEHLIALAGDEHSTIVEGAKQAALTLGWFERREEMTRAVVALDEAEPGLASLFQAFPGARIAAIRDTIPQPEQQEELPDDYGIY